MLEPLDIRKLVIFEAIARTGSFTRAARETALTQSAISHSLKSLESDLQAQLLDRAGRTPRLTDAGRILLERTRLILQEMDGVRQEILQATSWGKGRLRIGVGPVACQYLLPTILREFRECFPQTSLIIEPGDGPVCLHLLHQNQIDLALMVAPPATEPLEVRPLFRDELRFFISAQHRLVARGSSISLEDLAEERIISYSHTSFTQKMISDHFARQKLEIRETIQLGSMESIKEMVKIGVGIGILPTWIARREVDEGSLVTLPRMGEPLWREWSLCWFRGRSLNIQEETFLGLAEALAQNMGVHEEGVRLCA